MKAFLPLALFGLLTGSCSEPQAVEEEIDRGEAVTLCLNRSLAGENFKHSRFTHVGQQDGQAYSFVFHLFSGNYYPAEFDPPKPMTNMVIAAKVSDGYFKAMRDNPPKNYQDYEALRQRFGDLDDRRMLSVVRRQALAFLKPDLAAVGASSASVLPRQPYLVRDGKWLYQVRSDGPPSEDLRTRVREILFGIDQHIGSCGIGE